MWLFVINAKQIDFQMMVETSKYDIIERKMVLFELF